MNLKLPEELNQILSFAREEAMRLGSYTITGDHIFLAIIRHQENQAYGILTMLDLLLWQMKNLIESKEMGRTMIPPDQADKLSLSEHAEKCLKAMYLEATKLGQTTPYSLHLLLAMLALDYGIGVYWMRTKGVTDQSLRAYLKGEYPLVVKGSQRRRTAQRREAIKNMEEDMGGLYKAAKKETGKEAPAKDSSRTPK